MFILTYIQSCIQMQIFMVYSHDLFTWFIDRMNIYTSLHLKQSQ